MNDFKRFEEQDYATDYLGDGVRYRLPRRELGRVRHLGWAVVGFGLFMTLFMIAWMSGPILGGLDDLKKGIEFGFVAIAFSCFGLFGLISGLGMLFGGIAVICNRTCCEIEVRGGKIAVKDRFFFFRLRRKRPTSDIQRLRIADASDSTTGKQEHDTRVWLGEFNTALMAETGGRGKFLIAAVYPRELLVRLANELAPRLEADLNIRSATIERDPVAVIVGEPVPRTIEVVEGPVEPDEKPLVPSQPAGSTAMIERRPDGITIEVPPAGIWKGSKGLIVFAILWNAFISIFMVVAMFATLGAIEMEGDQPAWVMLLFMIPFIAVGVGLTIASVHLGRRHATIATADDLIFVVRHSIFGKTTREWSANQIQEICCGNSGMTVNDVPVKELQIIPRNDTKFGCLSQLEEADLVWVAAELNQALAIQRPSGRGTPEPAAVSRDVSGLVTPTHDSRITVDRSTRGICITVPPKGLFRYAGLVLFGFVLAAIGIGIAIGVGWSAFVDGFKQADISQLMFASVFLLSFGSIGSIVMLVGLVAGRRQFQLTVERDELSLLRRGPFGRKTFRWHRDDLESIEVTDSGTQVNNRTLYQVFIQSRKGNSVGIMTGHDSADLGLVAAAVQESLGLPAKDPAPE